MDPGPETPETPCGPFLSRLNSVRSSASVATTGGAGSETVVPAYLLNSILYSPLKQPDYRISNRSRAALRRSKDGRASGGPCGCLCVLASFFTVVLVGLMILVLSMWIKDVYYRGSPNDPLSP